ncbi:acyl-CoA synthetase [Variovorax sp. VNK109]|uniref:acyl-CoA synthetase n=1 Tax=Variovorax sp. VNK109 TaxID=3400919 RepID=UPI003BFFE120
MRNAYAVSAAESVVGDGFQWEIPEKFNIAQDVCTRWADGSGRLALIDEDADGKVRRFTFDELDEMSNRLANVLAAQGVSEGDRVAILLPQCVECALVHLASYKLGAVALPLFTLFGPEALEHRLADSAAKLLVSDAVGIRKINALLAKLPGLKTLLSIDATSGGEAQLFWPALHAASAGFSGPVTAAEDPALLIYTSGTTGKSKGALHAHRVLLGHLPGVEMSHDGLPVDGDLFWTPADWAWIGGLLDVLLPAWHHGLPVLSHRFRKFDAASAIDLMRRHRVRNVFLPPTALKQIRERFRDAPPAGLALRSIASGGESLGDEIVGWVRHFFGVEINEFYGQTECNVVVSGSGSKFPRVSGAIGKATPGHAVFIVGADGTPLPAGSVGQISVQGPDPVMFLSYWNLPEATRSKFIGDFLLTGDTGFMDGEGYVHFVGRDDDVITSAGYRIGPGPIEDCLISHPLVSMAAVVGLPDPVRTERVTAFVVLKADGVASPELAVELQDRVRSQLAAHEYPRDVHFVNELPLTTTGKIIRAELRRSAMASAVKQEQGKEIAG